MAENFCSAPLPHPLWDHYYAKALNQYYDSLEHLSLYKDGGLENEMRAVTIKTLEKYLHYECSLRPVFDGEVLYLDIHVFHHHFCHTQLSVFCVYLISTIPTYSH
jgi:hypothetical protein